MEAKKQYPGLDLFKFICAIFVLMLHANPFGNKTSAGIIVREIITPVAVPFFFMSSGFLWYLSYMSDEKKAKTKIFQTLKLYCYWSIIYFPFVLIQWVLGDNFNEASILKYLENFIFEGSFQTIWFLNALWLATVVVFILLKYFDIKRIFIISIPFYIIGCLLSSWHGFLTILPFGVNISNAYYSLFETTKNGILFGFIYVAMGCMLAYKHKNLDLSIFDNKFKTGSMLVVSIIAVLVEWYVRNNMFDIGKSCDVTLALVPLTFVGGGIAINLKVENRPQFKTLRIYSILLFLLQRIPLTIVGWIDYILFKYSGAYFLTDIPIVYFLIITASTFALAYCMIKISNKIQWISYLY